MQTHYLTTYNSAEDEIIASRASGANGGVADLLVYATHMYSVCKSLWAVTFSAIPLKITYPPIDKPIRELPKRTPPTEKKKIDRLTSNLDWVLRYLWSDNTITRGPKQQNLTDRPP